MSLTPESTPDFDTCDMAASTALAISPFTELSSLIPQNHHYSFQTKVKLTNLVERVLKQCQTSGTGCYILISGISGDLLDGIDTAFARRGIRAKTRFTFEPALHCLIIKLTIGVPHEVACESFMEAITDRIKLLPGHTWKMYKLVGSATYYSPSTNSRAKEADKALKPRTRGPNGFPSLVIEVGYSESLAELRCDASWWLIGSGGATLMVIIIEISRTPLSLKVECWTMTANPNARTRRSPLEVPNRNQYFEIDARGDVTGDPELESQDLVIPYIYIFDEIHNNMAPIVLLESELSELALSIFEECT